MSSAAYAAGPVGYLLAGPMSEALGVGSAFLILAVGLTVAAVGGSFLPALRGLDDPPPTDVEARIPATAIDPDVRRAEAHDIATGVTDREE